MYWLQWAVNGQGFGRKDKFVSNVLQQEVYFVSAVHVSSASLKQEHVTMPTKKTDL